jgi:dynein heavy chain, axonemal
MTMPLPHQIQVPLMERIAWKIADKVCTEINIRTVLHKAPEQAKRLIEEAKTVLDAWYSSYMDVRQKIEESGTDHRWQFDRKRLFEQTNYMAKVCSDLGEVRAAALGGRQPTSLLPHSVIS